MHSEGGGRDEKVEGGGKGGPGRDKQTEGGRVAGWEGRSDGGREAGREERLRVWRTRAGGREGGRHGVMDSDGEMLDASKRK